MMIMFFIFFFFKHKTAYEMRISDWSSDGCSSDLASFIKDHRSVLVRLQHAERIHMTILGVDIPVTISLLIAGEFRSHESTSCPSKDSSRIVRHHDWEASNPSRNHLSTSLSQRRSEDPTIR